MKKTADIIGLQLISITEGRKLGAVRGLVIDAGAGNATALVIEDNKWYIGAKFLPIASVSSIGEYAVTTTNSEALLPITEAPEIEALLEADIQVIGTKVLTTSGKIQGTVTELLIDDSGKIVECEIEDNGAATTVTADKIVTFGKEVLVVNDTPNIAAAAITAVTVKQEQPVHETPTAQKQEPPVAPKVQQQAAPTVSEQDNHAEDAAKKFDEKQRKYLLGKKSTRRIATDHGAIIVDNGGEITEEVLQRAKLAGKFVELSMSIQ